MFKKQFKIKADTICWRQFTRHADAAFLSLGREIRIGVLSAATLLTATPDSAVAKVATAPVSTDSLSLSVSIANSSLPLNLSSNSYISLLPLIHKRNNHINRNRNLLFPRN